MITNRFKRISNQNIFDQIKSVDNYKFTYTFFIRRYVSVIRFVVLVYRLPCGILYHRIQAYVRHVLP